MKRVLWLLLAACCTAFAPVQALAVMPTEAPSCCCGEECACDTSCELLATLPAAPVPAERSPATVELRRFAAKVERIATIFSIPAPSAHAPVFSGHAEAAPPDAVPRYCRHCAFLI